MTIKTYVVPALQMKANVEAAKRKLTANTNLRDIARRTKWQKVSAVPQSLSKFIQQHTGAPIKSMWIGDGPAKGAIRLNLGAIDEPATVWFVYLPSAAKVSGFVIEPSPSLIGYFSIISSASKIVENANANLVDLAPLVQMERALKFLASATLQIEKAAVKLVGVTPKVVSGIEAVLKTADDESKATAQKQEADLKLVNDRYMRPK